jgi:hypothetical protein
MWKQAVAILILTHCSSAWATWSMVVIPDAQRYATTNNMAVFNSVTQWIADNQASRNIQYVVNQGDMTDDDANAQWIAMRSAFSTLDGVVPYNLPTGNHDYDETSPLTWHDRITHINDHFSLPQNSLNAAITTQHVPGEVQNSYADFTAPDGRKMLVFGLEFWPRPEVVAWADSVASQPQFQDHTAVLATHAYMQEGPAVNGLPTSMREPGVDTILWNPLVGKNANFELVLNGHAGDGNDDNPNGWLMTARQSSVGVNGNVVHEIGFNAQQQPNGGNGYIRILEFLDDGETVQVRTYSPTLDVYLTDSLNEFQITLTSVVAAATVPEPSAFLYLGLVATLALVARRTAAG